MGINYNAGLSVMLQGKDGYEEFKGKSILMLGNQITWIRRDVLREIFQRCEFKYDKQILDLDDLDYGKDRVDSYELFHLMGFTKVLSSDVSSYEGADIIFDLSKDLPEDLVEQFDYIYDGGTLEHIFNVPKALNNIGAMCKIGGTIIHDVPCNNWIDHGFYSFSPTAFIDYYQVNKYKINTIFLIGVQNLSLEQVNVLSPDCRYNDMNSWAKKYAPSCETLCVCSVQKRENSTNDKFPDMQYLYVKINEEMHRYELKTRIEDFRLYLEEKKDCRIGIYGSGITAEKLLNIKEIREHTIGIYEKEAKSKYIIGGEEYKSLDINKVAEEKIDAILIGSEKKEVIDIIRRRIRKIKELGITIF